MKQILILIVATLALVPFLPAHAEESAKQEKKDLTSPNPLFDIAPAEAATNQHYHQPDRPQFHYTPIQGHIGDATGLILYKGEYHLFSMFDPWERRRNRHKCWGHAVSRDLLHWEQLAPVLDPEIDHRPGSGCGLVDWNNTLGLEHGPEKTLAIFYTDYKTGSCLAYSNDAGRTWTRYPGNPVLAGSHDARDPRIFWYEPTKEWRMVRYEDKAFVFYGAPNLLHWRELSRVEGYYECPDFFELPVEGASGERRSRWVLVGADGGYRVGTFDGTAFQPETEMLHVEQNGSLYAPQTWTTRIDDKAAIVQMAFLRFSNKAPLLTWQNQMCFPVEITLHQTAEGLRMHREPIADLAKLRADSKTWSSLTLKPGDNPLADIHGDAVELRAEIDFGGATAFSIGVRDQKIRYADDGALEVAGARRALPPLGHRVMIQLLVDRSSVELFLDHGRASVSRCVFFDHENQGFSLTSEGAELNIVSLEINHLKSIWP